MIEKIAAEMCIPKSFLAKILQKLSRAGIVQSYRGVKGGFRLTRPPKKITLLDVVMAIEGPVAMNRCTMAGEFCNFTHTCSVHPVWSRLRIIVEKYLRATDFEKMKKSSDKK